MAQSAAAKVKQAERMKRWRSAHKEHISVYQKAWREKNKSHVQAYQKTFQEQYRQRDDVQMTIWKNHLHKNYRMTPEAFNALWSEQSGLCAVCAVPMDPRGRQKDAVCVDHNHETGKVRGLLCRGCNHGIGNLKDSPEVLEAAALYLRTQGHYGAHEISIKA